MPADIDPKAGGAFSMFGGLIVGRNVELLPNKRIVQAWRPSHWDPGVYSIVRFQLKPQGSGTKVVLDHIGFPQGDYDHLEAGWRAHYSDGLAKYLA
ncbi:MAG: SRPBCC domain-containing protein [Candidatus Acidiferrum sp.]